MASAGKYIALKFVVGRWRVFCFSEQNNGNPPYAAHWPTG